MKPLPAGIISGFEWLENPSTNEVYAMLDGKRLNIRQVPPKYLRPFVLEMYNDEEFMSKNYCLSIPDRFKLYIRTYYGRFDEIPDWDPITGKTYRELNLDLLLTEKEKEILPYLSTGEKYPTIADKLNISINAFLKRLKGVFKKADVHCVRELLQMV